MNNRFSKILDTANKVGAAVSKTVKNAVDTAKEDAALYKEAKAQNDLNEEKMKKSVEDYSKTYLILQEEMRRLDFIAKKIISDYQKIDAKVFFDTAATDAAENKIKQVDVIKLSNALKAGTLGGVIAAGSVTALVASFCTAGTGAAISGLSGIFAVKATLAAMGGGTLAAGGFGMAGGVIVASAIFTIPAIAIGSLIAHDKVQETVKKVNESTRKVDEAAKINMELSERNDKASDCIRKIYDTGVIVDYFLNDFYSRTSNISEEMKTKTKKISNAIREKLVSAFLEIKPFGDDGADINSSLDAILTEIEEDCRTLQNISNVKAREEIYTSREINPVFRQTYRDAQKYIYMTYPWFNRFCVESDLPLIKSAVNRGVKFFICYGFGNNILAPDYQKTLDAVEFLKNELAFSDNVKFVPVNSHRKIILCEKYVLVGSQNMMTYRYSKVMKNKYNDVREEVTLKIKDAETVAEFKNLIGNQKPEILGN